MGPLQHVDLGGGPVRGLLAHRLGLGGWGLGGGREPVGEAEEHRGQDGSKPIGQSPQLLRGKPLPSQKRIKLNL